MPTPEERRRRHRRERIVAAALILILGLLAGGVVLYARYVTRELARQTTYVPKSTVMTPEVELLQQYVRFDTSNPPGNEMPAAQWLADVIRAGGVEADVIESAPGRGNVYARIKGREAGEGLLLLHHIDVVPATPQGWTRPPFAGEIRLDHLYGRGTADMKGIGIIFLRAFLDIARSSERPRHDLVFLAVADEEAGGTHGLKWLLEHRPDVVEGVRYALNEGGITEMKEERLTYFGIEIGTKLAVALKLAAPTREQLQRARIALQPWSSPRREPDRVIPEVRKFLRDIAPHRIEFRDELEDIDRTIANGKFWRLPVGYREVTQNNVWADSIRQRAGGGFEMRTRLNSLPDEDPDRRIAWLREKVRPFGVTIGELDQKEGPIQSSPHDTPLFSLLRREAGRAFGAPVGTEFLHRSTSDARFLRSRGIVVYGIQPFPLDFFQSESIHRVDERVRVEYFRAGVAFGRRLIEAWAFE